MPKIAVLGQKDALVRALYELSQLGRTHCLEVLVVVPSLQVPVLHGADVHGACGAFGFRCVFGQSDEMLLQELQEFAPDLIVSILWPRRVQEDVLSLCRDCINFHPSLLPRHRGSITQFWAIFDGDAEAGATCHRMVREFDAGRILDQAAFEVAEDETALSLSVKIAGAVEQCFKRVIRLFLSSEGLPEGREWDVKAFPYHFRKFPRRGEIDPEWPEGKIERFVRAMYFPPHPPAWVRGPNGAEHYVKSMEDYRLALAGCALPAPKAASTPSGAATASQRGAVDPCQDAPSKKRRAHLEALPWVSALLALFLAAAILAFPSWRQWRHGQRQQETPLESSAQPDPNIAVRYTLPETSRARCLDGSPITYYVAPGANADGRSRWLLYFQGGGWCAEDPTLTQHAGYSHAEDVGHPDLCSVRAKGYHGSSLHDLQSRSVHERGFLSGNASTNPMMHDWNRVILRNCDGALFMGSVDTPLDFGGAPLHFRGLDGVDAVLDALFAHHGLDAAEEVVLSGCSAGAVAAVLLADRLRSRFESAASARHGQTFVAVLSDSGVFPQWEGGAPRGLLSFPQFEWLFAHANVSGSLPPRCLEQGLSWRCLLLGVALPFVSTPVFLLQSAADSWHVSEPEHEGSLEALAAQVWGVVLPALRPPHAGAVDSCFRHCEQWGGINFGGQSNAEAFRRWYEARRRHWAAAARGEAAKDQSEVAEGWPLVHSTEPWVEGCYEGQLRHRQWHQRLDRISGS